MMKKIRSLMDRYAILSAFVAFIVIEIVLLGLGRLFKLLPKTLPMDYLSETVLMLVPVALVFLFGFSSIFKKGHFFRGLVCALPFIAWILFTMITLLRRNIENPEGSWQPWYMIVFGVFSVIGVGVREECLCRGVIQNIIAKKYANSVKGIWITVIVSAIIFGLLHVPNILVGMKPLALLSQVLTATFTAIFFGAVYLRSGSIWALILIHTLTDLASLAKSMFYEGVSDVDIANELSLKWDSIVVYLIFLGVSAFLLRPSKCKQIYESLCFADETAKTETDAEPEI